MKKALSSCLIFACMALLKADGGYSTLNVLDFFGKDSEALWKIKTGRNVNYKMEFGKKVKIDGKEATVLELKFEKNSVQNKKSDENWFRIDRKLTAEPSWKEASGIGVELAVGKTRKWWLQIALTCGGETFTKVLNPCNYTEDSFQDRLLFFQDFKNKNGKKLVPENIAGVSLIGSGNPNILYIGKLFLFTNKKIKHFVKFETNERALNIFQPKQKVQMSFFVENGEPEKAKFLECEVTDYFEKVVKRDKIKLAGNKKYTVDFQPELPGYYDVKAYWLGPEGRKLSEESCIKTTGSLPQGRGTFAVMPSSIEKNIKRMKELGDKAFFGFHGGGGEFSMVDKMGMTWRLGSGGRWIWDEKKEKPEIIDGTAAWAEKIIKNDPPKKECWQGFFNQCMNISGNLPAWAKNDPLGKAPGLKDSKEYFRYLRDRIKVNKHYYPHMKRRIYDIFWEVNLNKPKVGTHKPEYLPEDIVAEYKEARKIVDSEDPGAILAGPCTSSVNELPWVESLFKKGLLKYLDAYNCHGYHTPPPERGQIRERIRDAKKLIKKYNNGKLLDIYCTELGYRSQYGSKDRHKEHAQWHVRVAIILKGEGLKVYLPFYSYDFVGDNNTWGVCYNLDPKMNWGPKRVSPKAAVPALAVCVNELEGTEPVSDLPFFGGDIWCYIFKDIKTGKPVIALWSVHNKSKVAFPAGDVKELKITNIMGHRLTVAVKDGIAELNVSPSPIYIKGASKNIYVKTRKIEDNLLGELYPGEKKKLKSAKLKGALKYWGNAKINRDSSDPEFLDVSIPADCQPGPIPVLADGNMKWLIVKEPLEVVKVGLEKKDKGMEIELLLRNRSQVDLESDISLELPGKSPKSFKEKLSADSVAKIHLPLKLDRGIDFNKPLDVSLKVKAGNLREIKINEAFSFLTAHRKGEPEEDKLPNSIEWTGKGSDGKEESAKATFEWDDKYLYLKIKVNDDIFYQTKNDGTVWLMDSIQIAFDTHPELKDLYAPLAGVFTKKITEMAFARTPERNLAWRHKTHNEEELALGDISGNIGMDVRRDEKEKTTIYNLSIPWKEIGIAKAGKGKPIGIAILINDSDGKGTRRAGLELFGGIMKGKDYRLYGMFTLR